MLVVVIQDKQIFLFVRKIYDVVIDEKKLLKGCFFVNREYGNVS